jgi:hypothetical protein
MTAKIKHHVSIEEGQTPSKESSIPETKPSFFQKEKKWVLSSPSDKALSILASVWIATSTMRTCLQAKQTKSTSREVRGRKTCTV